MRVSEALAMAEYVRNGGHVESREVPAWSEALYTLASGAHTTRKAEAYRAIADHINAQTLAHSGNEWALSYPAMRDRIRH